MFGGDSLPQPFIYGPNDSMIGSQQAQLGSGSLAQSAANSYGSPSGIANAANQAYYDTTSGQQYVTRTVTTTTSYQPGVAYTTVAAGQWQPTFILQPDRQASRQEPKEKPITALDVLEKEGHRMIEV